VKAQSLPASMPAPVAAPPAVQPALQPSEAAPLAAPVITEASNPAEPVQVVLTAHERTWVSVKVDGKSGYTYIGTLAPNESRAISAAEQMNIMTGNAGGISFSLNGNLLEPIGRHGQPRTLRLTAEGPELLTRENSPALPEKPAAAPGDPL